MNGYTDSTNPKTNRNIWASQEGYGGAGRGGLHGLGGPSLDPKTVRTERHWVVRYMATIIGTFTMAMAY
jgi:hypothetical protein